MIPTNRGPMSSESLLGGLLYLNYSTNRDRSPHITTEQFKKMGYPMVDELEARYQAEKAIEKAAS